MNRTNTANRQILRRWKRFLICRSRGRRNSDARPNPAQRTIEVDGSEDD
jgi:hypothetical protein